MLSFWSILQCWKFRHPDDGPSTNFRMRAALAKQLAGKKQVPPDPVKRDRKKQRKELERIGIR